MTDLIEQWKRQRAQEKKPQKKQVARLKRQKGKKLDNQANDLHEEVFSEINCLDCANCCTSIPPMLNRTDISRIAKHLSMKVGQFEAEYLRMDEDGDMVMKTTPCPFLLPDHACLIYEHRPALVASTLIRISLPSRSTCVCTPPMRSIVLRYFTS